MMKIKTPTVQLIIWMTVLTTSLYVVAFHLPPLVGSFRFFWAPLALLAIFYVQPAAYTRKPMISLLLFVIMFLGVLQYTLWSNMDDWNRNGLLEEFYTIVVFLVILSYYKVANDFKGLARLGKLSFYFIIITIIMSHIALFYDPLIIRTSASTLDFTPFQETIYKNTGSGGYGYMQALVCFLPILIYHIKYRQRMVFPRGVLIVVLLLILTLQIRAQIFGNIINTALITAISFFGAGKTKISYILIAIVVILFWAIPSSFYSNTLVSLSSNFSTDSENYTKLNDFASFIEKPELTATTGAGGRAERYPQLFEALIASPFLGDASYKSPYDIEAGGHLYWMNKLTTWGIIGFSIFIYVLYQIYKSIRSLFNATYGFYYFLSVSVFVFSGLMKVLGGRESYLVLIIVIPGLYFLPLLEQKTIAKSKNGT
jgi:hypothetical protein